MRTLIKHANILDGRSPKIQSQGNLVIEEQMITEFVGGTVSEEGFSVVIDAQWKTVIPGLIDSHVHLSFTWGVPLRAAAHRRDCGPLRSLCERYASSGVYHCAGCRRPGLRTEEKH
jgi:cytosine/adenosine deaminase-related metal-dependent hydrolase